MSYINDALHKVQKEKESPYAAYGGVLSVEDKKPGAEKKRVLAAGLVIIFSLAAGLVALLYWPDDRVAPRTVSSFQNSDVTASRSVQSAPAAPVMEEPSLSAPASAQVTAPPPVKVEKRTPTAQAPLPEAKATRPGALGPDNQMKHEASTPAAGDDSTSLYTQALQKQREGRLEEAKELYKQVIRTEPRHLQALNNLGVVYLKMKRYRWAIIRFNDALGIKPDYVDAHYNLACLYAQKNDTKNSLFYLKNAVDINPEARLWAATDDDLKTVADLPEFQKIVQARYK